MPRRTLRALLLALLLALLSPPAVHAEADPLDAILGPALERAVARGAPGAVVAVSLPGRDVWLGARGVAERGGDALAPGARMRIASVTKLFVAVVALQLVQEGWLSLDHTVEQWLPGLLPRGRQITVRQLMRHTSGLPDYMDGPFIRGVLADPARVWRPDELVASVAPRGTLFRPGAPGRWSYSNTNYVVLGLIIERVTGNPLAREVHQRVLDPLGLRDTAFEPDDPPAGLAHSYERTRDLTGLSMSFAWAAGNMSSTAADLARFGRALFAGELLDKPRMDEMLAFGPTQGPGWSKSLRYGLGLMSETLRAGGQTVRAYGHTGMLGGYRSALWYLPDHDIVVVALLNEDGANPTQLAAECAAAVLAAP